jgi:voltage-gated sodium channel
VLNVLIGIVLNAMDEAREEDRTQREQLKNLKGLSADVSELSSSDKNVKLEIQRLRDELSKLESTITSKDQSPKPKA